MFRFCLNVSRRLANFLVRGANISTAFRNARAIFAHGNFLLASSIGHVLLNLLLLRLCGADGFIIANIVNTTARIVYNWRYIRQHLRGGGGSQTSALPGFWRVVPEATFLGLLFMGLFVMVLSGLVSFG